MLEDLIHCNHEPMLAVSEAGEILYWRCACGQKRTSVNAKESATDSNNGADRK